MTGNTKDRVRRRRNYGQWAILVGLLLISSPGDQGSPATTQDPQEPQESARTERKHPPAWRAAPPTSAPAESTKESPREDPLWRKRWHVDQRRYPFDSIPAGAMRRALEYKKTMPAARTGEPTEATQQSVVGDTWVSIGPTPIADSLINASGRIAAVAVDPSDPSGNTVYIGAASGGVWKTTDGGTTWNPMSDFEASLAVNSIALDPQQPSIVYAGTGEKMYGAGILRSNDGGNTWVQLGANEFDTAQGGATIHKVALDPSTVAYPLEQRIVYVASDEGLYRSADSGHSWANVLGGEYTDVIVDPVEPAVVYAAEHGGGIYRSNSFGAVRTWIKLVDQNGELPTDGFRRVNLAATTDPLSLDSVLFASMEDNEVWGQFKGIWKTSNRGDEWTRVTGHPAGFADGQFVAVPDVTEAESNDTFATATTVAAGDVVQGSIGTEDVDYFNIVLPGDPFLPGLKVSLSVEICADRSGSGLEPKMRLYKNDGSATPPSVVATLSTAGNLGKDQRVQTFLVDPGGYYLKVEGAAATTGNYQFSVMGIEQNCQCGYDQVIAVKPNDPDVLYMGLIRLHRSDNGGKNWKHLQEVQTADWLHVDFQAMAFDPLDAKKMVWGTDGGAFKTADSGANWSNLNTNLSITQIYPGIAQHPTNSGFMLAGTQDNGTVEYRNGVWEGIYFGDGSFNAIVDNQTWYVSDQHGSMAKTTDGGGIFNPIHTNGLGSFGAVRFILDPTDSTVLIAGSGGPGTPNYEFFVYRTDNAGGQWSKNSPDLQEAVNAMAFAPSDTDTYYVGTVLGSIWRTTIGGGTGAAAWQDLTRTNLPNRFLEDIAVHPTNPDTAYITFGGFGSGHVFKTTNGGGQWTDISSAPHSLVPLPDCPVNAIVVDPGFPNTLFVGTDAGIFRTTDGGVRWETFDNGLPNTQLSDLLINTSAGTLRASTYGRGMWELRIGNDICDQAKVIGDGIYSGSTSGLTNDGASDCESSMTSPDVWYEYTATCDGLLRVDTCGSTFDTVVSTHSGTCPGTPTNEQACNDDCGGTPCGGRVSCLTEPITAGQTRLIRLAGYEGETGSYWLRAYCDVPNDDCDEAEWITVGSSARGSTVGAGVELAPSCAGVDVSAPGVWYTVVGTGNTITASLCNGDTSYDTRLSVYCAGCGGLGCVTAAEDTCDAQSEVSWCTRPGETYHVLVHGNGVDSGSFRLDLSDNGTPCGTPPSCTPANDVCREAASLPPQGLQGDNTSASTEATVSCQTSNSDVWYDYTPFCQGFLTLDTCAAAGTLSDSVLAVFDGCDGRELACNDDALGDCGVRSELTLPVSADVPVRVRVAGFGSGVTQGSFPLGVSQTVTPLIVPPPGFYVADGDGAWEDHLLRVDAAAAAPIDVGALGVTGIAGLAFAPDLGLMYGIDDSIDTDQMVTIDMQTGAALAFSAAGFNSVRSLAYDSLARTLYGFETDGDQLIRIDPFSGESTAIGAVGFGGVEGLAFDPFTDTLYGSDVDTSQLIVIDRATGAGSAVGPFGLVFGNVEGLAFDTVERRLYGVNNEFGVGGRVLEIDQATGQADWVASTVYPELGPNGFAFVPGLPDAFEGEPYDETIPVAGGCPDYRFTAITGVPPELTVDGFGKVSGTPTASGAYLIGFDVEDSTLPPAVFGAALPLRVRPVNDRCAEATPVGDGSYVFSNVEARTDGPDEPGVCDFFSYTDVGSDIWHCYTAPCSGDLDVDLCDSAYDTKLAVYEGCDCPAEPPALACNDDDCGTRSRLVVPVTAGQQYLVRVGGFDGEQGSGTLALTCAGIPAGGCCVGASCSLMTEPDCLAMGGAYLGDDRECAPDSDGDLTVDDCDGCPNDAQKIDPGVCGCGVADRDTNGNGVPDCIDDDADGDGVPDPEDLAPLDPLSCRDVDGDQCDDCSSSRDDPGNDGPDADADGVCALIDCDDGNAATYPGAIETNDGVDNQCPGEPGHGLVDEIPVAGFFDPGDKTLYSWPEQPGAVEYQVARSEFPHFSTGCVLIPTGAPFWIDPDPPPLGGVFYYLVRAGLPNVGSWGEDVFGNERQFVCP